MQNQHEGGCQRERFKNFTESVIEIIRGKLKNRPPIVAEKTEFGHWEDDTVESKRHKGGIATFVDIKTIFLIIRKLKNKSSICMKDAVVSAFENFPQIAKTLTLDNGTEFALHDQMEKELNTQVYFAHPYSP